MAYDYLILNGFVLAFLLLLFGPVLRMLPRRAILLSLLFLLVLTAIFDSLIVGFGIVAYDHRSLVGLSIGNAPVEDFAYPVGAILMVPALWTLFDRGRKRS